MRLTVGTEALAEATKSAVSIQSKHVGNTLPTFGNVLLQANDGRLCLRSTELDLGVEVHIDCDLQEPGDVMVPAEVFEAQVKVCAGMAKEATLRTTPAMRLVVEAGKMSAKIVGQSGDNFPAQSWVEGTPILEQTVEAWRNTLGPGIQCHDEKNLQYALDGTELRFVNGTMMAAATDIRRANVVISSGPAGDRRTEFLPGKFVKHVHDKCLKRAKDNDIGILRSSQNLYEFVLNDMRVVTRQMLGKAFPPMDKLMTTDPQEKILVDRKQLELLLKAVELFATRGSDRDPRATLAYEHGELWLRATNANTGDFAASVEASTLGCEAFDINLNPVFLTEALAVFSETKEVAFFRPGKGMPIEIRPGTGDNKESRHWIAGQYGN